MPENPNSAAARNAVTGNSPRSSQPGACGSQSSRANARAVSAKARCSSDNSKSIKPDLGKAGAAQPQECARRGAADRKAAVFRYPLPDQRLPRTFILNRSSTSISSFHLRNEIRAFNGFMLSNGDKILLCLTARRKVFLHQKRGAVGLRLGGGSPPRRHQAHPELGNEERTHHGI